MFTKKNWKGLSIEWWQFVLFLTVCAAIVAICFLALRFYKKKKGDSFKFTTREMTYAGICLATALALMYFPLYSMPSGGSITIASMLPIMIFCYFFGFRKSLVICFIITLLQITYKPFILTPWSALLDYVFPYMALSLVGILSYKVRKQENDRLPITNNKNPLKAHYKFFIGVMLYFVVRYLSHTLGGVIFWSDNISFWIWQGDLTGIAAWGYSLTYNAIYLVPDTIIAMVAGFFVLRNRKIVSMLSNVVEESKVADSQNVS